jgi:hypothetical protein
VQDAAFHLAIDATDPLERLLHLGLAGLLFLLFLMDEEAQAVLLCALLGGVPA